MHEPPDCTVERPSGRFASGVLRVLKLSFATAAIGTSLITFPNAMASMIAFWLAWFSALTVRGKPGWAPLVACLLVLLAKGVPLLPGIIAVCGAMFLAASTRLYGWSKRNERWRKQIVGAELAACWLAWTFFSLDWWFATRSSRMPPLDATRPIICVGDSLTAYGYPEELGRRLTAPVLNRGRDGITTANAFEDLPKVLAENPQTVVVELGGHDFLKGYGRVKIEANLDQIITRCRASGAEVILVEIPRGLVFDPFYGLERKLARRHDLGLVSDTPLRQLVLWSPFGPPGMWLPKEHQLSDDGLHPNARGNQVLANHVAAALTRLYGPQVLRSTNE